MNVDETPEASSRSARREAPSTEEPVVPVSECVLKLDSVKLRALICMPSDTPKRKPRIANLECEGKLVERSHGEKGFRSIVSWATIFRGKKPVTITGQHELTFSVARPVPANTAQYYAEVNSVVLVYPYIRQLVDELTAMSLGYSVMVPPLDVPKFLWERAERKRKSHVVGRQEEGAKPDGAESPR